MSPVAEWVFRLRPLEGAGAGDVECLWEAKCVAGLLAAAFYPRFRAHWDRNLTKEEAEWKEEQVKKRAEFERKDVGEIRELTEAKKLKFFEIVLKDPKQASHAAETFEHRPKPYKVTNDYPSFDFEPRIYCLDFWAAQPERNLSLALVHLSLAGPEPDARLVRLAPGQHLEVARRDWHLAPSANAFCDPAHCRRCLPDSAKGPHEHGFTPSFIFPPSSSSHERRPAEVFVNWTVSGDAELGRLEVVFLALERALDEVALMRLVCIRPTGTKDVWLTRVRLANVLGSANQMTDMYKENYAVCSSFSSFIAFTSSAPDVDSAGVGSGHPGAAAPARGWPGPDTNRDPLEQRRPWGPVAGPCSVGQGPPLLGPGGHGGGAGHLPRRPLQALPRVAGAAGRGPGRCHPFTSPSASELRALQSTW